MNVPLVDLHAQYRAIKTEIDSSIQNVLDRCTFVGGPDLRAFEDEFAAYCAGQGSAAAGEESAGSESPLWCVGCGNGTDALYLALRAFGIGPGDEVITVSHTFIATAEAISMVGATPVLVDICEDTMLMDPACLERAITGRTKAVIAVHLYGQPCDMTRIMELARRHGLKVIEDAAQAHGAEWQGTRTGRLGDAACFSFYPGKNLGCYGDGGAVVSTDQAFIQRVRMLANHGRQDKYLHETEGVNSRLDGMQAAILRVKLRHLDRWNQSRREHAAWYARTLGDLGFNLPVVHNGANPVWHLFVIRTPSRDAVWKHLESCGVSAGVHYPIPLHLQPAYRHLGIKEGSLPVTERAALQVLSIPLYPELTEDNLAFVAAALSSARS